MKIIVVEDEVRIREGIRDLIDMLEGEWEFAGEAENGEAGLELIRSIHPDVVITDIRMAKMDGLEMLEAAREEGIDVKAVVLSAYSEFEYARTAMKMGVTEYLLKPVSIDEFFKALEHIRTQIEKEKQQQPDMLGSLEQVISAVVYGQLEPDEEIRTYLKSRYEIEGSQTFIEVCIYLGGSGAEDAAQVQRRWERLLENAGASDYCIIKAEYEKSLLAVVYRYRDEHSLKRSIQYSLMREKEDYGSIGYILAEGLKDLKQKFETIYNYMDWNVTLGDGVLITWPQVTQIQTMVCVYPVDLENGLKTELCLGQIEKVEEIIKKFHRFFFEDRLYTPKDIKECYIRFLWAAIGIMNEIGLIDYGKLNQQAILDGIMGSRSRKELEMIAENIFSCLTAEKSQENQEHLTVKRMKSMIHEFYQTGITLDEIARRLDVTPEYLSGQFHKVIGETFSAYMRNYRIQKAKELLLGTQMKLYEIAEAVGYSDGKYFSKVFRECTGCLPAEYRKRNK